MNVDAVLERLKNITGSKTNKELSDKLNVSDKVVSNWKMRNSIPLEILLFVRTEYKIKLDWLIYGDDSVAPELGIAEKMLLTAFNALDDKKKLDAIAFMSGLHHQNAQGISQSAGGNVMNMVGGNMKIGR